MKNSRITLWALTLISVFFVAGIIRLSLLRFQAGDVYPPLSSLRADPLGAKVLYTALQEQGGLEVHRNHRPLAKIRPPSGKAVTLIYAGGEMDKAPWEDLWRIAHEGNRVVVAFSPVTSVPAPPKKKTESAEKPKKETPKKKAIFSAPDLLHYTLEHQEIPKGESLTARGVAADDLEPMLSWHSVAWFDLHDGSPARTLYTAEDKPVIVEFRIGKGTLVLSTDSYFLTNEGLMKERRPHLLTTLIGNNDVVLFDEAHHHITEQSGVSTLIRQYNLEGCFILLALITALYIWKESTPLLPRTGGALEKDGQIGGRNSIEGLVNLLKRSIPPTQIVATCIAEWNKAFAHKYGPQEAPSPVSQDDPVQQFSKIANSIPKKIR